MQIEEIWKDIPVYQYSLDNQLIKKWENIRSAASILDLCESNINRACKRGTTCGGFKWSKTIL